MKKIFISTFLIFFLSIFELTAKDTFLSLKNDIVNVRYQPTLNSPIKYIYTKKNLPVKLIDKKENFRRIIDLKNNEGWIHRTQLKSSNSFIILENTILFKKPSNFSKPILRLRKGRLLIIKKCQNGWCQINTGDYSGWVMVITNNIWGSIN
jgi:SH3-like domain-containing protein